MRRRGDSDSVEGGDQPLRQHSRRRQIGNVGKRNLNRLRWGKTGGDEQKHGRWPEPPIVSKRCRPGVLRSDMRRAPV